MDVLGGEFLNCGIDGVFLQKVVYSLDGVVEVHCVVLSCEFRDFCAKIGVNPDEAIELLENELRVNTKISSAFKLVGSRIANNEVYFELNASYEDLGGIDITECYAQQRREGAVYERVVFLPGWNVIVGVFFDGNGQLIHDFETGDDEESSFYSKLINEVVFGNQ